MVAAPRAGALAILGRFSSPAWAAVLPAAIVGGTFGVLALPWMAPALVAVGFAATPLMAAVATCTVIRGGRARLLSAALAVGVASAAATGWVGQLAQTVLTALGCLAAGAILVRLVPRSWLPVGVVIMCTADVVLLGLGPGQPAGSLMSLAAAHVHTPVLDRARIGPISTDYPDLLLAAVLGSALAGEPAQRRAAVLVAALVTGYGLLLPVFGTLPATVPLAAAFVLVRWRPARLRRAPAEGSSLVPAAPALAAVPQEAPA